MNDDEDTPRERPRPLLDSESRRWRRDAIQPKIRADYTAPYKLLDRDELNEPEQDIVKRTRRESSDPFTIADFAKFYVQEDRRRDEERTQERTREKKQMAELVAILDRGPNEATRQLIKEYVDRLEQVVDDQGKQIDQLAKSMASAKSYIVAARSRKAIAKWILGGLASVSVSFASYAGAKILARAERDGEINIRIDHLERGYDRLQDRQPRSWTHDPTKDAP